jgi:hypothetical protein
MGIFRLEVRVNVTSILDDLFWQVIDLFGYCGRKALLAFSSPREGGWGGYISSNICQIFWEDPGEG